MKQRAIKKVLEKKAIENAEALRKQEAKRNEIFAVPEISNAQKEYINIKFCELKRPNPNFDRINSAKAEYENLLKKYGYSDDVKVSYKCEKCHDTGIVGDKYCGCIKRDYIKALAIECDILNRARFAFEDSNPSIASGEQKVALEKLYAAMEKYVDKYPDVKYPIILLSGGTGTGKSCLASAMARKSVLKYGRSALVLSAYELNQVFLKCHTSIVAERESILHDVMTVDMLVIDDLGTEPMLKNVTVEYLQVLIEERSRSKLSTVVTTNLEMIDIKNRYGERIFSRLSDKTYSLAKRIPGKDLRISAK